MASVPELEGTILTEGIGTGRGTRFATPMVNRKLETGGGERGIQGGRGELSGRATISVDPFAADTRPRMLNPLETKPVITNGSGPSPESIRSLGENITRATFSYIDKVDDLKADEAVLAYNDFARTQFFGDDKNAGLYGLKGEAAVSSREDYFSSIDSKLAEVAKGLEPRVRQKALARLAGIRDTALNRAASHIAGEQKEWEKQVQMAKIDDIARELTFDYSNAEGLKDALAGVFGPNIDGAKDAWDSVVIQALHSNYIEAYKSTKKDGQPGTGVEAAKLFQKTVGDTISVKAKNAIDEYIQAQESHEETAKRSAEADSKRQKNEALDKIYDQVIDAFDEDPTLIQSKADIYNVAPAFAEDGQGRHARALWRYVSAERKRNAGEGLQEKREDFYVDVVIPMREKGEVFPDEATFSEAAMDYGISDRRTLRPIWREMKERLTEDKRTLNTHYKNTLKGLKQEFMGADMDIPRPGPNADEKEIRAYERAVFLESAKAQTKKQEPQILKDLKGEITAIYLDKDKTPAQAALDIDKHIESRLLAAGASKEAANMHSLRALAEQYRFQTYVGELQARETEDNSGDVVQPQPLPSDLSTLERSSLANGYKLPPSEKSKNKIIAAAKKAGIENVEFVDNLEIDGEAFTGYVGLVKQADGSYAQKRLGIRPK